MIKDQFHLCKKKKIPISHILWNKVIQNSKLGMSVLSQ